MKSNLSPLVFTVVILCCLPFATMAQEKENPQQNIDSLRPEKTFRNSEINTVHASDFPENVNQSVFEILQGRITGGTVSVYSNGNSQEINSIARGNSTYLLANQPVLVVDGLRSPLEERFLDFENIESIRFIKGAAASALFGIHGQGPIIRITTKQPDKDEPLSLHYHGSAAFGTMTETAPVLSANAFRETVYDLYGEDSEAANLLGNANTNWQEELFRETFSHSHYLSATGTLNKLKIPYRASVKFSDNQDNIITSNRSKTSASLDLKPAFLDNTLKVHLKLNGFLRNQDEPLYHDNFQEAAIEFDPTQPVYSSSNPNSPYFIYTDNQGNQLQSAPENPIAVVNTSGNSQYQEAYNTNLRADYQLPFYNSIALHANYKYKQLQSESETFTLSANSDLSNPGVEKSMLVSQSSHQILDARISFREYFSKKQLNVDISVGISNEAVNNEAKTGTGYHLLRIEQHYRSIYSKVEIDLRNKYRLLLAARRDGTSFFTPDKRYNTYPAASLSWNISDETFMKEALFSNLQMQIGYGKTGNWNYEYQFPLSNGENSEYDKDIEMPITTTMDADLFFGLLNNRLNGSFSVYVKKSKDLLLQVPVAAGTDLANYIWTNSGEIKNKGFEFSLNADIIQQEKAKWNFGFNLSKNTNEIIEIVENETYGFFGGKIIGSFDNAMLFQPGNAVGAFYLYEQVNDQDGNPIEGMYVDHYGDGEIDDNDRRIIGNSLPDLTIGFHSRFSYNNMELSFSGRAWQGNYVYNNIASQFGYTDRVYQGTHLLNILENSPFAQPQFLSDYYLEDASFLKMDNITLSFSMPEIWEQKADVKLYLSVYNAFTITDYSGIDPEVYDGIESYYQSPVSRVFMLGVKADL